MITNVRLVLLLFCIVTVCKSEEITFFTWVPATEYQINRELIDAFETEHKEIRIKYINDPSKRAMDKLLAMFVAGTAPDVMSIHGAYFTPLADKGVLLDLETFIRSDKAFDLSDFYPSLIDGCRYKKKLFSLPRYTSVYVLFYNKVLFDREGIKYPDDNWTWDDYKKVAVRLTKDIDKDGAIDQYGCVIDFWGARLYPWVWQNGGDIFKKDGSNTICVIDQQAAVESIQFIVDLRVKYKVTPLTLQLESRNNVELFNMGKAGMLMSGAWDIQNLIAFHASRGNKKNELAWDIAPLPRKKQRATILGMENYAISAVSKNKQSAWIFLKYLLSKKVQKIMFEKLEKQPTLKSLSGEYIRSNTRYHRKVLVDALQYAKYPPNIPEWNRIEHYLQEQLDLIWLGKISVTDGLSKAVKIINSELKKSNK